MKEKKHKNIPRNLLIAAASSFALKILLERQLKLTLSKFFKQYQKEIFDFYGKTGILRLNIEKNAQMQDILLNHYKNVSNRFRSSLRDRIGIPLNNNLVDNELDVMIDYHANNQAHQNMREIMRTTENDITKSIKRAEAFFAAIGFLATRKQIAIEAQKIFRNFWQNRIDTIVLTETQMSAETTKFEEAKSLIVVNAEFPSGLIISDQNIAKSWVAILDGKTREWHREADGQTVNLAESFIVKNEELLYPSDSSRGASAENIINCRCSAEIIIS